MNKQFLKLMSIVLVSTITFIGCNVTQSDFDDPAKMKIQMRSESPTSIATKQSSASVQSEHVEITEVKMFIDEMELEGIEDNTEDFETENFIINLPLDGSPIVLSEVEIPDGVYDELKFKVRRPHHRNDVVEDEDLVDGNKRYSLVVKGIYNGEEFVFKTSKVYTIKFDLNPALEINADSESELMISVDVNKWFVNRDGSDLDPTSPRDTKWIEHSIRRSFVLLKKQFADYDELDDSDDGEESDGDDEGEDDSDDNGNDDGDDDGEDDSDDNGNDDGDDDGEDDSDDNGNDDGDDEGEDDSDDNGNDDGDDDGEGDSDDNGNDDGDDDGEDDSDDNGNDDSDDDSDDDDEDEEDDDDDSDDEEDDDDDDTSDEEDDDNV